jgi:hypothetical protein
MGNDIEHTLEIEQREGQTVAFRSDLRKPVVAFGRCAVTGEWGETIGVDMGSISIDVPNTEKGVKIHDDGRVEFTIWEPRVVEQQLSLSRKGLCMLFEYMRDQESPIPSITPELVYQWCVMDPEGGVTTQFVFDAEGKEHEQASDDQAIMGCRELRLLPHGVDNSVLPQYAYSPEINTFYKNGIPIDTMFDAERPLEASTVFCRQNTITMGSTIKPGSLSRALQLGHVTVLQCIGWCVGGITALNDPTAKKCMICVDERGNWRPWKYTE